MKPMTKLTVHRKSPIMKRMLQVNPDAEPEPMLRPHMTHCARAMAGKSRSAKESMKVRQDCFIAAKYNSPPSLLTSFAHAPDF